MHWPAAFVSFALALAPVAASAQAAGEADDLKVPPTSELRLEGHATATPLEIPGARIIFTPELRRLVQLPAAERPLLFDVLGADNPHLTLPDAIWLGGAGRGQSFDDELQARLARALEAITKGDRRRALVFFCASVHCWLSYNAALRAVRLGYENVRWYRGGIEAWGASGGALAEPALVWK